MRCACIDIGSNTTRVLVADVEGGRLDEVLVAKAYTRLGRELRRTGRLPEGSLELVCDVVAEQIDAARRAGATVLQVVATAAIRGASDGETLRAAIERRTGVGVDVLTGEAEARLAFAGAVRTHDREVGDGRVAVVDIGGGSCEVAVGTALGGVEWSASLPVGSGSLADAHLRSDPPGAAEIEALRRHARAAFADVELPAVSCAIAVGGSAASTARMVGRTIGPEAVTEGIAALLAAPADEIARRHGLDTERVRLLPAGLALLGAAAGRLGCELETGCGGLREGVCLELGS
jgi:exopolyphosphatase/guanosine-5'-triphosphate,3'-diphosphate pyrophosphatase